MSTCAIIAEYNPLHNGHIHQIKLAKENHENIVIIMSGSFVQRGDVAIIDKWKRAECAILCGADLVLELPTAFAMSTAERFAFGGVSLANKINIIDSLCFGSECGDIELLSKAAECLIKNNDEITRKINELIKDGSSYAKARMTVADKYFDSSLLQRSNNILGIEYIKQLILTGSKIVPETIKRLGNSYNDTKLSDTFSSATAIRSNISEAENYIPSCTIKYLTKENVHRIDYLYDSILFYILQNGPDGLKNTLESCDGIENRIYASALSSKTIYDIIDSSASAIYTRSKIRRVILASMLGIGKELLFQEPSYARVLGASENGRKLISKIKDRSNVDIITKVSAFKKENTLFEKDILATSIYNLSAGARNPEDFKADFYKKPFIL